MIYSDKMWLWIKIYSANMMTPFCGFQCSMLHLYGESTSLVITAVRPWSVIWKGLETTEQTRDIDWNPSSKSITVKKHIVEKKFLD